MPEGAVKILFQRQVGRCNVERQVSRARDSNPKLNLSKTFVSGTGGITWLDLDFAEHRYLLASSFDGSIVLYDAVRPSQGNNGAENSTEQHDVLGRIDRATPEGHKYAVSCVAWYPVDTGLFISGSFDNCIKVWDTELLKQAATFATPVHVHNVALSKVAVAHCLVAAAGSDALVRLCDISSGAFTHTLTGHTSEVWALHWSPASEWMLISGGCDGQVRVWDVRMSGCIAMFDQHMSQPTAGRYIPPWSKDFAVDDPEPDADLETSDRGSRVELPPPAGAQSSNVTAHDGAITAVVPSPDSLFWLTAGTDSRVRQWDGLHSRRAITGQTHAPRNMLINFANTFNRASRARQLAVGQESDVLYHPTGSIIQLLRIGTGEELGVLRGHMDTVHACVFNPALHELYSGGSDCQLLAWTAAQHEGDADQDTWSGSD